MSDAWGITGLVVFSRSSKRSVISSTLSLWSSRTACSLANLLVSSIWSTRLQLLHCLGHSHLFLFSQGILFFFSLTSFISRQVMLPRNIPWWFCTFVVLDLDIIPIRTPTPARYCLVLRTNICSPIDSLFQLPVWFIQVLVNAFRINGFPTHRLVYLHFGGLSYQISFAELKWFKELIFSKHWSNT